MGASHSSSSSEAKEDLISDQFTDKRRRKLVRKYCLDDIRDYQLGYPEVPDHPEMRDNYLFYSNRIPMRPLGKKVEEFLEQASRGDLDLERQHGFVQWLFPVRETGLNLQAQPLQLHEARAIAADETTRARVLKAYILILRHWGIELVDRQTGELQRTPQTKERFQMMVSKTGAHNLLRISRVLKSLGELGLEHLKAPLVEFLLYEVMDENGFLRDDKTSLQCLHDFWIPLLRNKPQRESIRKKFIHLYGRRKVRSMPLTPEPPPASSTQEEEETGFFHRFGSLRNSLGGTIRRSLRQRSPSGQKTKQQVEKDLLEAEKALTSHLVQQETKRVEMLKKLSEAGGPTTMEEEEVIAPPMIGHEDVLREEDF